jgi:hypothetical protein
MSKQSDAKAEQGYSTTPKNCGNCAHRTFVLALLGYYKTANERSPGRYSVASYGQETKNSCGLGGFAIKKTATCQRHEWAEARTTQEPTA